MNNNPLTIFREEALEVAKAFDQLIEALKTTTGLDAKTKQLVYIGIKSVQGDAKAVFVPCGCSTGVGRVSLRNNGYDIDHLNSMRSEWRS